MKTKKSFFRAKNVSAVVVMFIVFLASCQKDNSILNATDTQNVNEESASAAYTNESNSVASSVVGGISGSTYSGGRASGVQIGLGGLVDRDDRLKCATVTINRFGTKENPAGRISIKFDSTCTDKEGNKRSGNIVINYSGRRWMPGSYFSIHANFFRNDTHIQGVDSVLVKLSADSTSLGYLEFQSILTGGKITFGDGTIVTRDHNLTREWFRATIPSNDEWHTLAGGTAAGIGKKGNTYQVQITKDLVEKVSCRADKVFIPVSGVKVVTVGSDQYVVDYGDGTCDNIITVTVNGVSTQITVSTEGN